MLRLKKAIVEFAFLEMLLTCLLQERLLLMVTPRYFESVFVASCVEAGVSCYLYTRLHIFRR